MMRWPSNFNTKLDAAPVSKLRPFTLDFVHMSTLVKISGDSLELVSSLSKSFDSQRQQSSAELVESAL